MTRAVCALILTFLFAQTSQQPRRIKPPLPIPTQARTMTPEKAVLFRPVPVTGTKAPSLRKPHFQPLSDAEKRLIIQHTVNVTPSTITPFLTLTTKHLADTGGFLEFSYPQSLTPTPAIFDGNLPGSDDCSDVYRAEGMDLYLYAQPNQNYLVDLVVVISNGQRRFQITQQEFGLPGQQPPPVTKDQDVGIPNAPSFSHVTTYIAAPNGGSSAYWLQLHYALEPYIQESGATPGTWSFMEADVSYY